MMYGNDNETDEAERPKNAEKAVTEGHALSLPEVWLNIELFYCAILL